MTGPGLAIETRGHLRFCVRTPAENDLLLDDPGPDHGPGADDRLSSTTRARLRTPATNTSPNRRLVRAALRDAQRPFEFNRPPRIPDDDSQFGHWALS